MVLERDSWLCRYCRARLTDQTANIDHVLAWPEGLTVLLNLVACCRSCNQKKGRSYVIPHPVPGERWYR